MNARCRSAEPEFGSWKSGTLYARAPGELPALPFALPAVPSSSASVGTLCEEDEREESHCGCGREVKGFMVAWKMPSEAREAWPSCTYVSCAVLLRGSRSGEECREGKRLPRRLGARD